MKVFSIPDRMSSRCSVYQTGVQSIPTATWTKLELNTEDYDNDSEFDPVTNYRFTAIKAGYYHIDAQVWLGSVGTDKKAQIGIYKNGVAVARSNDNYSYDYMPGVVSKDVYLNGTTDYIEIYVWHNSGVNRDTVAGESVTWLSVHRFA